MHNIYYYIIQYSVTERPTMGVVGRTREMLGGRGHCSAKWGRRLIETWLTVEQGQSRRFITYRSFQDRDTLSSWPHWIDCVLDWMEQCSASVLVVDPQQPTHPQIPRHLPAARWTCALAFRSSSYFTGQGI